MTIKNKDTFEKSNVITLSKEEDLVDNPTATNEVSLKNNLYSLEENNDFVSLKEACAILGCQKDKFLTKIVPSLETNDIIETKTNANAVKKLYKKSSIINVSVQEKKNQIVLKNQKIANKLNEKHNTEIIAQTYQAKLSQQFSDIPQDVIDKLNNLTISVYETTNNYYQSQKTIEQLNKEIEEKDRIIQDKDNEIKQLRDSITLVEEKGNKKELQKKFSDYVKKQCKENNLNYSDTFNDLYFKLGGRYSLDFTKRQKGQSIIEYIAGLSNGKKYLNELLDITMVYFINNK